VAEALTFRPPAAEARIGSAHVGRRIGAAFVACLALASCRVEKEDVTLLPWLSEKRVYRQFGSFDGSRESTFYTKRFGLWWSLDVWEATVLDPDHALTRAEDGYGILRRGERKPVPVCRDPFATLSFPPLASSVDCASGVTYWNAGLVEVRFLRLDFSGRTLADRALLAPGKRLVFPTPAYVFLYDEAGVPYFLLMDFEGATDRRLPSDCALLAPGESEPRLVAGSPELSWEECHRPETWRAIVGRPLRQAGMTPP
jgi:hypothetical protein